MTTAIPSFHQSVNESLTDLSAMMHAELNAFATRVLPCAEWLGARVPRENGDPIPATGSYLQLAPHPKLMPFAPTSACGVRPSVGRVGFLGSDPTLADGRGIILASVALSERTLPKLDPSRPVRVEASIAWVDKPFGVIALPVIRVRAFSYFGALAATSPSCVAALALLLGWEFDRAANLLNRAVADRFPLAKEKWANKTAPYRCEWRAPGLKLGLDHAAAMRAARSDGHSHDDEAIERLYCLWAAYAALANMPSHAIIKPGLNEPAYSMIQDELLCFALTSTLMGD